MELEKLLTQTEAAIRERIGSVHFQPCKVSIWIKFVRRVPMDGAYVEEPAGPVHKLLVPIETEQELIATVAENMVLAVFGGDLQVGERMPNLIVKLFDRKAFIPLPGNPPVEQPDQVYLKATVYRYEPSLWDQFFKRKPGGDD